MSQFDLHLQAFPLNSPYAELIADDPPFDPARHLALGQPESTYTLADFGYGDEVAGTTPSTIAATSCFRVLSDEGVAAMYHVCKQLEAFTTSNPRIQRNTRGGVYRSRFLRDFSLCAEFVAHLSGLMQTPLLPLALGHNLAHLNYQPETVGKNVDKWHYDTLQVDTVMFVTDPRRLDGGEFQYFRGTRAEMAALKRQGCAPPPERIVNPAMPGPGYAILMQGNYVVHQARALGSAAERITLVNGFSYADPTTADYTAVGQLLHADPHGVVGAEYTRHMLLRCARQMAPLINQPDYTRSPAQHAARLTKIRAELDAAIMQLNNAGEEEMKHFGD